MMTISTSTAFSNIVANIVAAENRETQISAQVSSGSNATDLQGYANHSETLIAMQTVQGQISGFLTTGLLLAERAGIDRKRAVEVMTQSPIGSPMLKARADLVLDLPDEAWFDVGLLQKDVVLALDTARQLGVPLLPAAAADEVLTLARAAGYEHRDIAALFEVLAQLTSDTSAPPA